VGEFPVTRHYVDAEKLRCVDHVLPLRPQRGSRAFARVAAVAEDRSGTLAAQALDECGELRKAAHRAERPCRMREIEVRECVRLARAACDAEVRQQCIADEMRRVSQV